VTIALIVHGGASAIPPEEAEAYRDGCLAAVQAGWAVLERGGDALDAVEAAIRTMEEDETFNAARGGMLNADGQVSLCSGIMEGAELRFGALGAALGLRHPISVARQILGVGPLLLVGEGVWRFAETRGAELCDPNELITDKQRRHWEEQEEQLQHDPEELAAGANTVGCVALDARGLLAAGTSTGGQDHTPPGRVGDSPLPGCGLYADNTLGGCAVSGTGEAITQVGVARSVIELLAAGLHPDIAAQYAIDSLAERVQGEGGCIVLDRAGRAGWAHNSSDMSCALMTSEMEQPAVWLKKPAGRVAAS
jgi:L-asparaginase / beta-aspartyl-peptidase